ncbi:hypothetical protein [Lentilactobacillus sp. SPB1-3]|uniref:Uncharacterized protein n=1 Tax=Lentilactobacillus terminaliae TaxID=3003483 RepID=A0ACD5DFF6_9LACO|nr:hypothetical protein [Lentilactobacillus sp. SPB1-3]MCZ0976388.1 hypothetical protein [Lentilactobacillus sp. SPB1-3]
MKRQIVAEKLSSYLSSAVPSLFSKYTKIKPVAKNINGDIFK